MESVNMNADEMAKTEFLFHIRVEKAHKDHLVQILPASFLRWGNSGSESEDI